MASVGEIPERLGPFDFHGVAFEEASGNDLVADCVFCHKRRSLTVNKKTTKWTCHSGEDKCGRTGNVKTFLAQYYKFRLSETDPRDWKRLAANRKIPWRALRDEGLAWDSASGRWMIPIRDADGNIHDVRVWKQPRPGKKSKVMNTKTIPSGLWGLETLRGQGTVWVCEGEWDGIILRWLLRQAGRDDMVVAVPGGKVLKTEWVEAVVAVGERVIICGDNDSVGEAMAEKWWTALRASNIHCEFLCWPDGTDEEYDTKDLVVTNLEEGLNAPKVVAIVEELVGDKHPRMPFEGQEDVEAGETGLRPIERRRDGPVPVLEEMIEKFSKWLRLTDDLKMAIRVAACVHVTASWSGDCPLWVFLVGAPGSGKSEILMSMADAPGSVYQSSVNRESLLSGFSGQKDPSLIPKLIGRCGIFKDWTEMLEAHPVDQKKAYSCLRGFYDGRVDKIFGNGQERHYIGTCSMIAGTTNDVYKAEKASVGERFVKFHLPRPPRQDRRAIVVQAILNVTKEKQKDVDLKLLMRDFLDYHREPGDPADVLGMDYINRLWALCELIGILRQSVDWGSSGGYMSREVAVRPDPEMPTRLSKELTRLALADTSIRRRDRMDDETWRLVERVAFNTAAGFNLDVVEAMMCLGGRLIDMGDLEIAARLPRTTLDRRIECLEVLGIVVKKRVAGKSSGRPRTKLSVSNAVRALWDTASPAGKHLDTAIDARTPEDEE